MIIVYEKIKKGTDRRASLIALKKELKDEAKKKVFLTMTGNRLDEIMKCLVDEDPKVRKNAAAILEEMTGDTDLVSDILLCMTSKQRAAILAEMDPVYAAKLTVIMYPAKG